MAYPISNRILGRRIHLARTAKGLTQEALGRKLNCSENTIRILEAGGQDLVAGELSLLSAALGCSVNHLIEPFNVAGEARYCWRIAQGAAITAPSKALQASTGSAVGFYRWLRKLDPRHAEDPTALTLRISGLSSPEDAEGAGERLGRRLKLGAVPAAKIAPAVDCGLDMPLLFVDLNAPGSPTCLSAVTVRLSDMACILIDRSTPARDQAYNVATCLFNAMTWDALSPASFAAGSPLSAVLFSELDYPEFLADCFASALLIPCDLLEASIARLDLTCEADFISLADRFCVSAPVLAFRLMRLKRIDDALYEKFRMISIADAPTAGIKCFSYVFVELLATALKTGQVSPRLVAKTLGLNLDDLDGILCAWHRDDAVEF